MNDTEKKTIHRADALRQMGIHEDAQGKKILFSLQFYKNDGELVRYSHCHEAGLRQNMKALRLRGIQQTDHLGNPIGRVKAVCIDNLREYNGLRITL